MASNDPDFEAKAADIIGPYLRMDLPRKLLLSPPVQKKRHSAG
jgi:hypothetical protein